MFLLSVRYKKNKKNFHFTQKTCFICLKTLTGTLIDEDDPAFMDLNKLFHSKDGSKEDQPDGNADEDDEGEDPEADADDSNNCAPDIVDSDASDAWISAIVESGDSQKIGIVSVCVLSNEVKATLLDKDEGRQQLADYLDLLQVLVYSFMQEVSLSTVAFCCLFSRK